MTHAFECLHPANLSTSPSARGFQAGGGNRRRNELRDDACFTGNGAVDPPAWSSLLRKPWQCGQRPQQRPQGLSLPFPSSPNVPLPLLAALT